MARFASDQPDLFAPPPRVAEPPAPTLDPIIELRAIVARLEAADLPFWNVHDWHNGLEARIRDLAEKTGEEGRALFHRADIEILRLYVAFDKHEGNYIEPY
jgi:hypothetical protein